MATPDEETAPPRRTRVSYAQNQEDILLARLFGEGTRGHYVDIGSCHPTRCNNTRYFHERGWRGVNIEPTPRGHALFQEARPHDLNLALALSDHEGAMTLFEVEDEPGNSTVCPEIAASYREQGRPIAEHAIPVRTLASLIEAHGIAPPEILSIDVEGHEGAVLRGAPLDRWQPAVLVVESTLPWSDTPTHDQWEPLVLGHGYVFAAFNGVNRFYLRADLADRRHLLATPVNSLDHFELHEVVEQRERADDLAHRLDWELNQASEERARHEQLREAWEWSRGYTRYAEGIWKMECESIATQRATFVSERERFEREGESWKIDRAAIIAECQRLAGCLAEREAHLAAAQRNLRPYRLIDRMGLVSSGYTLARRLKPRRTG